jgi:hypothetical protein
LSAWSERATARTAPAWIGYRPLTHLATVSHRVIWASGRPPPRDLAGELAGDPTERRSRLVLHQGGRQEG